MKFDEFRRQWSNSVRKPPSDEEHRIQVSCVRWFRMAHPQLAYRLFAVPNGGRRDGVTGARLKEEGVLAGVADLILLVPNAGYHALLIEMKTPKGRQSESQKAWQQEVAGSGDYLYVVCRGLDEFIREVEEYLQENR